MIPQLRKLEEKYAGELVVLGVHSPKFTSERETENLRHALLRHRIGHPVVNDRGFDVWGSYGCRAWPTLVFVDPEGKVIGKHEGEIPYEALDELVGQMVAEFDRNGTLDRWPVDFGRESEKDAQLSFPGKVLAEESAGRLFIADTGHNRVIVASLEGEVRHVIGAGTAGLIDGGFPEARFDHPQGMSLAGEALYVADTENHAIRRVDLASQRVVTVAGTGEQGGRLASPERAKETALRSPWDLALHGDLLFIAMAGLHQLWVLDIKAERIRVHAGNGREAPIDGPLLSASLDQPSGLATDGKLLYFADSEASAIRTASLEEVGSVGTIVGQDLFVFGDVDGMGDAVRLQHPLGICFHDGVLYVADSYNNKIKRVLPLTRSAITFAGTGEPGHRDGPAASAQLHEPSGLSVAGGKLYVADSNNHAIRVADLATGEVSTLELRGL